MPHSISYPDREEEGCPTSIGFMFISDTGIGFSPPLDITEEDECLVVFAPDGRPIGIELNGKRIPPTSPPHQS